MDIEDAHKLKILTTEETKEILLKFYDPITEHYILDRIDETCKEVTDVNEQIAYIRAGVIGKLVSECVSAFIVHYDLIMSGNFKSSLIKEIGEVSLKAYNDCTQVAISRIYRHRSVVEIELAGYKILGTLLEEFVTAVMEPDNFYSKNLLSLIPDQYQINGDSDYEKILSVLDFVSGMTDVFALELYRTIKGIELPGIH